MSAPLLALDRVTMMFGGLKAVSELSLEIATGELVGLIGPNGAGKTTVFNLITGVYAPTMGRITLEGRPIQGLRPHVIAHRGITRTFQNIRLFSSLCCRDNVAIAAHQHAKAGLAAAIARTPGFVADERTIRGQADELLAVLGLTEWADVRAAELPYGQQRRLEIARALAGRPRLLLLDEPAAGLNGEEQRQLAVIVRSIRDSGVTVVLIEHNMGLVMSLCSRVVVLDSGTVIAEGAPAEVARDPLVLGAYLGSAAVSMGMEAP